MMSRMCFVKFTDLSEARERGRESMTYTINQRIVSEHRCGKNQYATKPGSAVVPCIEYKETAAAGINGI